MNMRKVKSFFHKEFWITNLFFYIRDRIVDYRRPYYKLRCMAGSHIKQNGFIVHQYTVDSSLIVMTDGNKFEPGVVPELEFLDKFFEKLFETELMSINADRKTKSRILHQVDVNIKTREYTQYFAQIQLVDKRKVAWRNRKQCLVYFKYERWDQAVIRSIMVN